MLDAFGVRGKRNNLLMSNRPTYLTYVLVPGVRDFVFILVSKQSLTAEQHRRLTESNVKNKNALNSPPEKYCCSI